MGMSRKCSVASCHSEGNQELRQVSLEVWRRNLHNTSRLSLSGGNCVLETLLRQEQDEVLDAGRVAPLVVIPAEYLHHVPDHFGQRSIDDRRKRIASVI